MTALEALRLSMTHIGGAIPSSIGGLTNIKLLDVSGNLLTGSLPSALGSLTACVKMDFSMNKLSGSIPTEVLALPALEYLVVIGQAIDDPNPKDSTDLYILKDDSFNSLIWGLNAVSR